MQVILFNNVDKLGMKGDIVNVANGYFRNYLGPQGIAIEASEGNLKRLEVKRKKMMLESEKQRGEAELLSEKISSVVLNFKMKTVDGKKLFGSVSEADIVAALGEKGFEVERRQIAHEPFKTIGRHDVRIKLVGQVEAHIKVVIEDEKAHEEELRAAEEARAAEARAAAAAESETNAEEAVAAGESDEA